MTTGDHVLFDLSICFQTYLPTERDVRCFCLLYPENRGEQQRQIAEDLQEYVDGLIALRAFVAEACVRRGSEILTKNA